MALFYLLFALLSITSEDKDVCVYCSLIHCFTFPETYLTVKAVNWTGGAQKVHHPLLN